VTEQNDVTKLYEEFEEAFVDVLTAKSEGVSFSRRMKLRLARIRLRAHKDFTQREYDAAAPSRAIPRISPLFQKGVATMITKECFGCEKVTSHEHLHECAPGIPETHMVGSERFVCVLCKHVTFAGSDGASRFPFTFDKVAAGR